MSKPQDLIFQVIQTDMNYRTIIFQILYFIFQYVFDISIFNS